MSMRMSTSMTTATHTAQKPDAATFQAAFPLGETKQ